MSATLPRSPRIIPVIGIIGGIGSGKSSVAQWVGRHANVAVIDADALGHEALKSDSIKASLRQRFGQTVFTADGEIQRGSLAKLVFGNDDASRTSRRDLEAIVHPAIEQKVVSAIGDAERSGREAVLLDAAVLLEAGWQQRCQSVVFVDVSEGIREQRVAERNGWSRQELQKREASQMDLAEKRRRSNLVISNEFDVSKAGQELLDFLCRSWGVSCKPLPNASQQS